MKWSDQFARKPGDLRSLLSFCEENNLRRAIVTSRTLWTHASLRGVELEFMPASIYCYVIGFGNIAVKRLR